jgi:Fur family transcriptional regulator, ferric uptake regulator
MSTNEINNNNVVIKKFREFLDDNHYRKTQERMVILKAILSKSGHFSVDDINKELDTKSYHVSRATIYNTFELLVEAGILHTLISNGVEIQYERFSISNHTHLVCTICGKIKDVKDNNLIAFMNTRKYTAFAMSYYTLYVYGICNSCARKLKSQSNIKKK